MGEKLLVALLSVVVAAAAVGGSVWLIAVGEVTGVERLFVIFVTVVLVGVCGLCLRLEFPGAARPVQAPAATQTAERTRQNSATASHVHASI